MSGAALLPDGRIVVDEAEAQLARTLNPWRGRPPGLTFADAGRGAAAPAGDDRQLLREIADVRLQRERLALAEAERAAAFARAELVNAAAAAGAWRQAMAGADGGSLRNLSSGLPAKLGLGNGAADVARRSGVHSISARRSRRPPRDDPGRSSRKAIRRALGPKRPAAAACRRSLLSRAKILDRCGLGLAAKQRDLTPARRTVALCVGLPK